jgi:hypothetical protein
VVETTGLENRRRASDREFESRPLRQSNPGVPGDARGYYDFFYSKPRLETVDYGKMTAADLSIGYFVSALIPLFAIRNSFASFRTIFRGQFKTLTKCDLRLTLSWRKQVRETSGRKQSRRICPLPDCLKSRSLRPNSRHFSFPHLSAVWITRRP